MHRIEFVQSKERVSFRPMTDVYELNQKLGWWRLQRLAGWFLKKIGAQYQERVTGFERIVFQPANFVDALIRQHHDVMRILNPDRPLELLIGPDEFSKLTGAPEVRQLFGFNAGVNYGDRYGTRILGMRVTVVPRMNGIVLVPQRSTNG